MIPCRLKRRVRHFALSAPEAFATTGGPPGTATHPRHRVPIRKNKQISCHNYETLNYQEVTGITCRTGSKIVKLSDIREPPRNYLQYRCPSPATYLSEKRIGILGPGCRAPARRQVQVEGVNRLVVAPVENKT